MSAEENVWSDLERHERAAAAGLRALVDSERDTLEEPQEMAELCQDFGKLLVLCLATGGRHHENRDVQGLKGALRWALGCESGAAPALDALFDQAEVETVEGYGVRLRRMNRTDEEVGVFQLADMAGRVLAYGDRGEIEERLAEMAPAPSEKRLREDWEMPPAPTCSVCGEEMRPEARNDGGWVLLMSCPKSCATEAIAWPFVKNSATAADLYAAGFRFIQPGIASDARAWDRD